MTRLEIEAEIDSYIRDEYEETSEAEKYAGNNSVVFEDGNTLRVADADTDDSWLEEQVKREKRERFEERRRAAERRERLRQVQNQEKAMSFSASYTAFLFVATIITCAAMMFYIQLRSEGTTKLGNISSLESRLANLQIANEATEKRIATASSVSEIRDTAIGTFKMHYPESSQIVYYSVENSDYMTQYGDIPD